MKKLSNSKTKMKVSELETSHTNLMITKMKGSTNNMNGQWRILNQKTNFVQDSIIVQNIPIKS